MKILIVGGGVAGPALAGLMKDRAQVTLIDKAPKWGDIGYGIALWGNGRRILNKLGAEHAVAKNGYEIPWNVFENKKGHVLNQVIMNVFKQFGPTVVVTRTALHQALISTIEEGVDVRLGTTVKELEQRDRSVHITFSDGREDTFDLVVGADGIHSQIRHMVFGDGFMKPYGWTIWAFWTPKGFGSPRGAIEVADLGRMYFAYPMQDRATVMLASASMHEAVPPEERQATLRNLFGDFFPSVSHMIDAIEDPLHILQDDLSHIDMPVWYKGRVVLLGDAQHATSPITGMGASMAMEDSYVLAEELARVSPERTVEQALAGFAARRSRRIKEYRRATDLIERWMMVRSPTLSVVRNAVIRLLPSSFFSRPIQALLERPL